MNITDSPENRRTFLCNAAKSIGLVLTAPAIATILQSCETDEKSPTAPTGKTYSFDVTTEPALTEAGGIALVFIEELNGNQPVFVSRVAQTTFAVFSSVCTHAGCGVLPPESTGANCVCPCHRAEYSPTDGAVRRQPNTGSARDLPRFASQFDAETNILTITA